MDYFMVNISNIPGTKINDKVLVIGDSANANYWSNKANTIPYEITTLLNPRIKRIYTNIWDVLKEQHE